MQFKHILRTLITALILVILSSVALNAQEENLLENPGFENGFAGGVATGWESWVSGDENAPDFQEDPDFIQGTDASDNGLIPQVRGGNNAQALFSFFASHDAGIYQQVSGVTKGTELRFSIYAHVFSNSSTDVDRSEVPGGVTIRVGVDPNGGTDPFSSDVVYTEPFITYDTFIQYSTIAVAAGDTVTVFVRSTVTEPVQNTIVFLDDAVLNVTPESSVPDETEEPQVEDPTPTREGDTGEAKTEEPATEETSEPETEEPATEETSEPETEEPVTEEPATEETSEPETEEPATEEPATEETSEPETEEPDDDAPISDTFPGTITHTVRSGDTVGRLAVRYGSSTQAIIQANGLNESALIFVGQGLLVPVRIVPATETPSPTPVVVVVTATPGGNSNSGTNSGSYIIQPGDTLSSIARQFNTTVGAIVQLNGIANPNRILVGQSLNLPGTGGSTDPAPTSPPPATEEPEDTDDTGQDNGGIIPPVDGNPPANATYVVQPGDNLYRIALRNGVSLSDLAEANNISNFNLIFVGQVLTIP